jgi:hypothetical protein
MIDIGLDTELLDGRKHPADLSERAGANEF